MTQNLLSTFPVRGCTAGASSGQAVSKGTANKVEVIPEFLLLMLSFSVKDVRIPVTSLIRIFVPNVVFFFLLNSLLVPAGPQTV